MTLPISEQMHAAEALRVLPCVSPAGRVESWVLCKGCRYRLVGLDPSRSCPECGRPIAESTCPSRVRSLSAQGLRTVRSSADSMRVAATLALLAGTAVFVQPGLAAILAASAIAALCIGPASLDTAAPGTCSRSSGSYIESAAAAVFAGAAGAPFCLLIAWLLLAAAPQGGLFSGESGEAVAETLGLLMVGLASALFMQPLVVWLHRIGEFFADAGNADLVDNARNLASLLRGVQCIAIVATPVAPLWPHAGFVAVLAGGPLLLTALGVLLRVLAAVRRAVGAALAESVLRDCDAP